MIVKNQFKGTKLSTNLPTIEIDWKKYSSLILGKKPNVRKFACEKTPLGEGSFGRVFEGYEVIDGKIDLNKPLAIKEYKMFPGETQETALKRLDKEAELQRKEYDTEVLPIGEKGVATVMPRLSGKPMNELIKEIAKLTLSQRLELAALVAQTYAEFHARRGRVYNHRDGLYHTDLKPDNFIIDITYDEETDPDHKHPIFKCHIIDFAEVNTRNFLTVAPECRQGKRIKPSINHALEMETFSMVSLIAPILGGSVGVEFKFSLKEMGTFLRRKGQTLRLAAEMEKAIDVVQSMGDENPAIRPSDLTIVKVLNSARIACLRKEEKLPEENAKKTDEFFTAIQKGELTAVKIEYNLRQLADKLNFFGKKVRLLSEVNVDGLTAFGVAIKYGQYDIAKYLLQKYTTTKEKENAVKQADGNGRTLLHLAVLAKRSELVKLLLENGADVNQLDTDNRTPLECALSMSCDVELVQLLLNKGADVSKKNNRDKTPLQSAIINACSLKVVEAILEKNDTSILSGTNLLLHAVLSGSIKLVQRFWIESGLAWRNGEGESLLHLAVSSGHVNVAKFLLKKGVDINATDNKQRTPLHLAVAEGKLNLVDFLIKENADVNRADNNKRTLLHLAILTGQCDLAKSLVLSCARPSLAMQDREDCTPLHLAILTGQFDLAKWLILHTDASLAVQDSGGRTPFHLVILAGNAELMRLLCRRCSPDEINLKDKKGFSTLDYAVNCGHHSLQETLRNKKGAKTGKLLDNEPKSPLSSPVSHSPVEQTKPLIESKAKVENIPLPPVAENDATPVQPVTNVVDMVISPVVNRKKVLTAQNSAFNCSSFHYDHRSRVAAARAGRLNPVANAVLRR